MTRHLLDEVLDAKQQRGEARPVDPITERVQRGATLLDEWIPGWWHRIDLGRLDIDNPCDCVAGQLGGYTEILQALRLDDGAEHDFGFDGGSFAEVHALTEVWRSLILARRDAAEVTA